MVNPFKVIAEELPKWYKDENQEDFRDTVGMMLPQDLTDASLMVAGGPFSNAIRKGALALGAAGYAGDAEAGGAKSLAVLKKILNRASPGLIERAEALYKSAPVTFEAFDPLAIRNALKTTPELRAMTPSEYLKAAAPMGDSLEDWDKLRYLRRQLSGDNLGLYNNEYPLFDRRQFRGFDELPHLSLAKESSFGSKWLPELDYDPRFDLYKVAGHEGRHRMSALRDIFGNEPVGVTLTTPWDAGILPDIDRIGVEGAKRSGIVGMPQRYAGGGVVGGINAWLEQKRRQAKRSIEDWLERPEDTANMTAARLDEDMTARLKDPTSALDFVSGPIGGLAGVIKDKGGQWLEGRAAPAVMLKKLKQPAYPEHRSVLAQGITDNAEKIRQLQSIPEHTLTPDARRVVDADIAKIQEEMAERQNKADTLDSRAAVNDWIDRKLNRYIKTHMATPEDPIRKLAEQDILHVDPELLNFNPSAYGKYPSTARFLAESPTAKAWEGVTDNAVLSGKAGSMDEIARIDDPWLDQIPPETPVYGLHSDVVASDFGFDHLVDELRNAANPGSDLPRNLQLSPAQINQMGIDQAVRHVANINKWRADNRISASLENMEKFPVIADYPDTGFKWIELKAPEWQPPEGYEYLKERGHYVNPWDETSQPIRRPPDYGHADVRQALKEEGDAMGHCVGGYCDDVLSGNSRILSLRDANGQPHVTIELSPGKHEWVAKSIQDHMDSIAQANGLKDQNELYKRDTSFFYDAMRNAREELRQEFDELFAAGEIPPVIKQVKGKGNLKPSEKYIPYVQDLIQNKGPWREINDLENTDLMLDEAGKYVPILKTKYASGGLVTSHYVAEREKAFANGGLVKFENSQGYILP